MLYIMETDEPFCSLDDSSSSSARKRFAMEPNWTVEKSSPVDSSSAAEILQGYLAANAAGKLVDGEVSKQNLEILKKVKKALVAKEKAGGK